MRLLFFVILIFVVSIDCACRRAKSCDARSTRTQSLPPSLASKAFNFQPVYSVNTFGPSSNKLLLQMTYPPGASPAQPSCWANMTVKAPPPTYYACLGAALVDAASGAIDTVLTDPLPGYAYPDQEFRLCDPSMFRMGFWPITSAAEGGAFVAVCNAGQEPIGIYNVVTNQYYPFNKDAYETAVTITNDDRLLLFAWTGALKIHDLRSSLPTKTMKIPLKGNAIDIFQLGNNGLKNELIVIVETTYEGYDTFHFLRQEGETIDYVASFPLKAGSIDRACAPVSLDKNHVHCALVQSHFYPNRKVAPVFVQFDLATKSSTLFNVPSDAGCSNITASYIGLSIGEDAESFSYCCNYLRVDSTALCQAFTFDRIHQRASLQWSLDFPQAGSVSFSRDSMVLINDENIALIDYQTGQVEKNVTVLPAIAESIIVDVSGQSYIECVNYDCFKKSID